MAEDEKYLYLLVGVTIGALATLLLYRGSHSSVVSSNVGVPIATAHRAGRFVSVSYDSGGRITGIIEKPIGSEDFIPAYDKEGRIVSILEPGA